MRHRDKKAAEAEMWNSIDKRMPKPMEAFEQGTMFVCTGCKAINFQPSPMVDCCSFCDGRENGDILDDAEVHQWNVLKIRATEKPTNLTMLAHFVERFAAANLVRPGGVSPTGTAVSPVVIVRNEKIPALSYVTFSVAEFDTHTVRVKVDADSCLILESCDGLMCIFTYTEYAKWLLCSDQDPGEPVQSFPDPSPWA